MVYDTSELCKDVQVVTEILADTKTEKRGEGGGGCVKAPEETPKAKTVVHADYQEHR